MSARAARLRRAPLSVPGSNAKMMEKAAALAIDCVFLDLEDAVAPGAKAEARPAVAAALRNHAWKARMRGVRINDAGTPFCHEDIIEVVTGAGAALDVLILTKVKRPSDVLFADTLLTQLERKLGLAKPIGLEALIEDVEGLIHVEAIAAASPRLEALILGMGDYAASQGMNLKNIGEGGGYPGDIWYYPRFRMTAAARAHGLDAIDGPYANFRDEATLREECRRVRLLGLSGKWAIHPSQVGPIEEAFSPDAEEVAKARRIVAAYAAAQGEGKGAIEVDGVMIDVASIRVWQALVDRATLIGM